MAKRYNILTRCLAALALLFVYVVSTSAILVGGTTTSAQASEAEAGAMVADTRAVTAEAEAAAMAEVMASMAPPSSFARVLAAGGTPTVNASAGGDIGSIDVAGLAGVGNKIKGVPDNRRAFSFLAHRLVLRICFRPAISVEPRNCRTSLPTAESA